jgi:hypothetical protein
MSHQDGTQEPTLNAAQERVTPDELAQAVAAVEARRDAEARKHHSTIPLGEAVRQLGLETTPEELLSEVRRQRARHAAPTAPPGRPNRKQDSPLPLFMGILLAMMLFFGSTMLCLRHALDTPPSPATPSEMPTQMVDLPDQTMQITSESFAPTENSTTATVLANEETAATLEAPPTPTVKPGTVFTLLANIRADQDVKTDFESLRDLANGKSPGSILVAQNSPADDKMWTIFKHEGHLFVRCFALPSDASRAMNGRPTKVYASPHDTMIDIQLPLGAFNDASMADIPGMTGANIYPQAHAPSRIVYPGYPEDTLSNVHGQFVVHPRDPFKIK